MTARYNPPPSQKSPSRSRTRRKANNIVDVDISAADVYDCPTHTPLRANRRQNLSRCEEVSRMTKTCDLGRAMSSFKKIISGGRKPNGRYSRPPGLGYSGSSSVLGGLDNTRKKKKKESRDIVPQVVID